MATDDDGRVIGCVALHVFWEDLAELKCLAVLESTHGQGVGRALLEACCEALVTGLRALGREAVPGGI